MSPKAFLFGMLFCALAVTQPALAKKKEPIRKNTLVDGQSLQPTTIDQALARVQAGSVVIVSELHGFADHHENQYNTLLALKKLLPTNKSIQLSVGLEFLSYTQQSITNDFLAGRISEQEFTQKVKWGKPPFHFYRRQATFPRLTGGHLIALNSPRWLSGKIAKQGLSSLTPEEKALFPPNFQLGSDLYYEKFKEPMSGHIPEDKLLNYFAAQSLWDETMAWRSADYLKQHPNAILVIIVGDFHAAHKLGLPARLAARGINDVTVISQVDANGLSQKERSELIGPHRKWGQRADFVWITE